MSIAIHVRTSITEEIDLDSILVIRDSFKCTCLETVYKIVLKCIYLPTDFHVTLRISM